MERVVLARADLIAALRGLTASSNAVAVAPAALTHVYTDRNLLVGPFTLGRVPHADRPLVILRQTRPGEMLASAHGPKLSAELRRQLLQRHGTNDDDVRRQPLVLLTFDSQPQRLVLDGVLLDHDGALSPIDEVVLVGPGLARFEPGTMRTTLPRITVDERFSRVAGALSLPAWSRLSALRVAIVGCGRAGAMLALLLEDLGVCHFVLIDPDEVEAHNLGPLYGRSLRHVGRPKVEALAEAIRTARQTTIEPGSLLQRRLTVRPVATSVTTYAALDALLAADLIVTTTDHDGARAYASLVAQAYLKLHLDLGTGIVSHGPQRDMGATVRLAIPGEACLFCLGGFADWHQIQTSLGLAADEVASRAGRIWHQERAGSLPNLNLMAISQGVTWVQDLLAEILTGARLLDLTIDSQSQSTLRMLQPDDFRRCPFCNLRGQGDDGRRRGLELLQDLSHRQLDKLPN